MRVEELVKRLKKGEDWMPLQAYAEQLEAENERLTASLKLAEDVIAMLTKYSYKKLMEDQERVNSKLQREQNQ